MYKRVILLLPLVLAAFLVGSGTVSNVHAGGYTGTGVVCITASSTATNCPGSAPTIGPVTVGSSFTVGVFVNNSAPMGGFDIYVAVNASYLNPTSAALGPLIASPTNTNICINGVSITGSCTGLTANGPGVVEVSTVESSGMNECSGGPCSGMAFNITYQVVGSTASTPISYPVDGTGCSTSSVASPANVCVLVLDATGTTLPQTVQGAIVTQTVSVNPTSTAVSCTSPVVVGKSAQCTATVTDTGSSGASNPTGQVTFSTSGAGAFSPSACTLSPLGANKGTCFSSYTPSAVGTGTHNIGASYPGDTVHTGSSTSSFPLAVTPAGPTLGLTTVRDSNGQPVSSSQGIPVGSSVHNAAILLGGYPVTGVTGTVTFTEYANGNCAGAGIFISKVTVGAGNSVPNSASVVLSSPGSYSFQGIYSGDVNSAPASNGCLLVMVGTTTTTIVCLPTPATINITTTCTATVTDTSTNPATPSGSVNFATNSTGTFTPASATCTLAGSGATATCSVTYKPSVLGHHMITGTYGGDSAHVGTANALNVAIALRTTTTGVTCSPSTDPVTGFTTCTATVTDTSSGATSPSGSVSFATNSTGTFTPSTSCTLTAGSSGTATCSVTYTPALPGHHMFIGSYGGDSTHAASSNTFSLAATIRSITTAVSCSPSSDTVDTSTTCTVTVTDTSSSPSSPTGTVSISTDSPGTFSYTSCTLAPATSGKASCSVSYTPSSAGSGTHSITAIYSGDSTHATASGSSTLTVTAAPASTTIGLAPAVFYALVAAVIALAGALGFFVLRKRGPTSRTQATGSPSYKQ